MDPIVGGLIIGGIIAIFSGGSDDKGKDKDKDNDNDYDNGCNCSIDQN